MSAHTVTGLWIDNTLSRLERLSITSYLAQGHAVQIFTYADQLDGLPEGVSLRDARDILPDDWRQRDPATVSYAGVADLFRYTYLLTHGGTWSDLDIVCLRPLPDDPILLVSEGGADGQKAVSNQFMRLPAGDPLAAALLARIDQGSNDVFRFMAIGPWLVHSAVQDLGYWDHVRPPSFVNPVPTFEWYKAWLPEFGDLLEGFDSDPEVFALHLWHEHARRTRLPKQARLDPACLISRLEARFGLSDEPRDAGMGRVHAIAYTIKAGTDAATDPDPAKRETTLLNALSSDPSYTRALEALLKAPGHAPARALDLLQTAAAEARLSASAWLDIHRILRKAGQETDIALHAAFTARDKSDAPEMARLLSALLAAKADPQVHSLLGELPDHIRQTAPLRCVSARMALTTKDPQAALDALQDLDQSDPDVADLSARAHFMAKRPRDALAHAEHAQATAPSIRSRLLLAEILLALGETAKARPHLEALLKQRPGNRRVAKLLARLGPASEA